MAHTVIMPRQGQSVESCVLGKWHKQQGDPVSEGDLLFTYETDKSTFEEYAKNSGTMLEIFFDEGDDVPCLQNVCVIGSPGEKAGDSAEVDPVGKIKISPRAKNAAARAGADYNAAVPTGPNSRVIERDIDTLIKDPPDGIGAGFPLSSEAGSVKQDGITHAEASLMKPDEPTQAETVSAKPVVPTQAEPDSMKPFTPTHAESDSPKPSPPHAADYEFVKHSVIRRAISRTMTASLRDMAQLTLNSSFDASDILGLRAKIKKTGVERGLPDITVGDMILYAVSRVLPGHRALNAHCDEAGLKIFSAVHLGVAVDSERGLMVPTLFNAERMSLTRISEEVKRLSAACRDGSIRPDALSGGTFTVTNLGPLGIESFTPVINPPQTAILGVCSAVGRTETADGQLRAYPAIGLSLTFDHRATDGAPAARFLADLARYLKAFTFNIAAF